ncbi:MAG: hypothetical protein IJK31_00520 [Ruminococcus sp.]|nr:hypothetical protein [Ruminococcus sp.]
MATISIPLYPGVTAGIDSFEVGTAFAGAMTAVSELIDALDSLKDKILSAEAAVDLDESWSDADNSEQREEIKESSLSLAYDKLDDLLAEVGRIDSAVAELISERKDDFYDEYDYLKPDCEKSDWELFWDDVDGFFDYLGDWLAENWASLVCVIVTIVVAAVVICICIVTFGAGAVALAALIGMAVGLAGQLISDVITWAVTGEWQGTWQGYLGAALGGALGGVLTLAGFPNLAIGVEAGVSTFFTGHLSNITGGEHQTFGRILFDTGLSVGFAYAFSFLDGKFEFTKKLGDFLGGKFNALTRLTGTHSYSADYSRVLTRLRNGTARNFTSKTVRNGLFGNMFDGIIQTGVQGIGSGIDYWVDKGSKYFFHFDIWDNSFTDAVGLSD